MELLEVNYSQYYVSDKEKTLPRLIESYELEFYETDTGCAYVNGEKHIHKKGMVLFARPGDVRRSENAFKCYGIHFNRVNDGFIQKYLRDLPTVMYLPKCKRTFHELVFSRPTNPLAKKLHQQSLVFRILSEMHEEINVKAADVTKVSPENILKINKTVAYIKNDLKNKIDIDTLYKNEYMSRSSFFSLFKSVTGLTPSDYINTARIEHAKMLLDTTNLSLVEVAFESGFNSQAYFNVIFKEKTGMTPGAYKEIW